MPLNLARRNAAVLRHGIPLVRLRRDFREHFRCCCSASRVGAGAVSPQTVGLCARRRGNG
eukprot:5491687-Pleurochrysis_carterae.AAC.1